MQVTTLYNLKLNLKKYNMVARIIDDVNFGGLFTDDYFVKYPELTQDWVLTPILPNGEILPIWNGLNWIESYVEVVQVPQQLSRMKFIIQVFLTTGITYEDIVLFIENLTFDVTQKYVILTRLKSATHFDRNSNDLLTIAGMMGITSEQLDEIFINGNLIE